MIKSDNFRLIEVEGNPFGYTAVLPAKFGEVQFNPFVCEDRNELHRWLSELLMSYSSFKLIHPDGHEQWIDKRYPINLEISLWGLRHDNPGESVYRFNSSAALKEHLESRLDELQFLTLIHFSGAVYRFESQRVKIRFATLNEVIVECDISEVEQMFDNPDWRKAISNEVLDIMDVDYA